MDEVLAQEDPSLLQQYLESGISEYSGAVGSGAYGLVVSTPPAKDGKRTAIKISTQPRDTSKIQFEIDYSASAEDVGIRPKTTPKLGRTTLERGTNTPKMGQNPGFQPF